MLNLLRQPVCKAVRLHPKPSYNYVAKRTVISLKDHKYTARATATGLGRNGHVQSDGIGFNLATPKELGGTGNGQNPEQLFAMGYSSCLLGAIQLAASRMGKAPSAKNAVIRTSVHLGEPKETGGFGLAVDIEVEGVTDLDVVKAGHQICPYSRAIREGIEVKVSSVMEGVKTTVS